MDEELDPFEAIEVPSEDDYGDEEYDYPPLENHYSFTS